MKTKDILIITVVFGLITVGGCAKVPEVSTSDSDSSRYLYVSSGLCYSGNNTTFTTATSSNLVYRVRLSDGGLDSILADYMASPSQAGDSPTGMFNADDDNIYVLVENASTALRRVEKVEKKAKGARSTMLTNATAFNTVLRDLFVLPSGNFVVAKSSGIEHITTANVRLGAPYINATAAPCNTSTTLMTKVLTLSNGKFVFLHASAGQNRFGIFESTGGITCAVGQNAPTGNAYPTAAFYDATNSQLIVAYAGNSVLTDINSIYAYSINETTNAIGAGQKLYDASLYPATYPYLLYGISEMAYDSTTSSVYVATAITTATTIANYAIEKLTYDPTQIGVDNTKVLTRAGSLPFVQYGGDTKCISKMFIAN